MHDLRKLKFTCPRCDCITKVNTDNIIIHIVECEPIYNTIEFMCESCGDTFHLFGMCHYIYATDLSEYFVDYTDHATDTAKKAFNALYIAEPDSVSLNDIIEFGVELDHIDTIDQIDWGSDE